jgi:hypothetical protein
MIAYRFSHPQNWRFLNHCRFGAKCTRENCTRIHLTREALSERKETFPKQDPEIKSGFSLKQSLSPSSSSSDDDDDDDDDDLSNIGKSCPNKERCKEY